MDTVKIDLATADEKQIAALVISGSVQLDEIPVGNRNAVARKVEDLRAEAEAAAKAAVEADKPKVTKKKSKKSKE